MPVVRLWLLGRVDDEGQLIMSPVLVCLVPIAVPLAELHPEARVVGVIRRVGDADESDRGLLARFPRASLLELVHRAAYSTACASYISLRSPAVNEP
eukprot:7383903-Prymnesium_polylepis.2